MNDNHTDNSSTTSPPLHAPSRSSLRALKLRTLAENAARCVEQAEGHETKAAALRARATQYATEFAQLTQATASVSSTAPRTRRGAKTKDDSIAQRILTWARAQSGEFTTGDARKVLDSWGASQGSFYQLCKAGKLVSERKGYWKVPTVSAPDPEAAEE